jgi:hypothetical protein
LAYRESFEKQPRKSKRELFLDQMSQMVALSELLALVEPAIIRFAAGWPLKGEVSPETRKTGLQRSSRQPATRVF